MPPVVPDDFAAFIGLDWAAAQHDVGLQAAGSAQRESVMLEHPPETIDAWGSRLGTQFKGQALAICLERNKGPRVSALRTYDLLLLLPIPPLTLARSREACTPSRATDAPTDAALPLELRLTHRDKRRPLTPPSPSMRAREPLVAHRRCVVHDTGRLTTRLPSALQNSCPQVLPWFQDTDTVLFCDFLQRWPTLTAAQRARRSTLATCFHDHHGRSADVIATRLRAITAAMPLTTDEGVIAPHALLVQTLVSQLRVTLHAIAAFDTAIAQRAQSHPACALFPALPGAGPVLAPRLLVAFGAHRERSASATAFQQSAGVAPVPERSGKKSWVHWRRQCPTFLRHTCVEWAAEAIRHAFWARGYDQQQRDKGTAQQAAVRALAFQWMRMLSRGWQERSPYDESPSLQALHRRGSSLIHNLAKVS